MRRGRSSSELPLRPAFAREGKGGPFGTKTRARAKPARALSGVASDASAARLCRHTAAISEGRDPSYDEWVSEFGFPGWATVCDCRCPLPRWMLITREGGESPNAEWVRCQARHRRSTLQRWSWPMPACSARDDSGRRERDDGGRHHPDRRLPVRSETSSRSPLRRTSLPTEPRVRGSRHSDDQVLLTPPPGLRQRVGKRGRTEKGRGRDHRRRLRKGRDSSPRG